MDPSPLSDEHLRLLHLLVRGGTDQQVARALGISRRTLSRRLLEVMDVLGAGSRFQAGYLLATADLLGRSPDHTGDPSEDADAAEAAHSLGRQAR